MITSFASLCWSAPLEIIVKTLEMNNAITASVANYENNHHSANENIRLHNLWDGIEVMACLRRWSKEETSPSRT